MTRVLALRNRQTARALHTPLLRRIICHLLQDEFAIAEYELCFHLVDAQEMARINERFLNHPGSTDVITFDHAEQASKSSMHGEIFISVPDTVKHARDFGTTWPSEVARYVIHGLLHLRGYDDLRRDQRREMKREENRLLRAVQSKFAHRKLARKRNAKREPRNNR
jgi:probable rRNA maturation factor